MPEIQNRLRHMASSGTHYFEEPNRLLTEVKDYGAEVEEKILLPIPLGTGPNMRRSHI